MGRPPVHAGHGPGIPSRKGRCIMGPHWRQTILACFAAAALSAFYPSYGWGQEKTGTDKPADGGQWRTVKYWVAEVIGSGGKVDEPLGKYDTYDEAEQACQ